MIWILGASGYIGQTFVTEAKKRKLDYRAVSRQELDYTDLRTLLGRLKKEKPEFVVNAAGFTGKPNVDACENQKGETVAGNVTLAQTVAAACDLAGVKLGFVSSGCIYTGAKVRRECGTWAVEDRLTEPLISELLEKRSERVKGFSEEDKPNFCFGNNNCSFYSGTKAMAEEVMKGFPDAYVWRLRIPFDEYNGAKNYLSKIQRYAKVYQNWNSLTHRGDFASASLDLWQKNCPSGTYNITNPGYISTQEVVRKIKKFLRKKWLPEYWFNDDEFYRFGASTPRSNCILDSSKLLNASVKMRSVDKALEDALSKWKSQ